MPAARIRSEFSNDGRQGFHATGNKVSGQLPGRVTSDLESRSNVREGYGRELSGISGGNH